ncbi:hypothetical protein HK12_10030 [Acetobacter orientalis]|uniref:Poly-beta-1,6-N-acetyl-D-glucosamine biosynthesis protein PgaD n=2 Tax=Acetobacter orientalis TaxID=146474 RepID=A0A251ZZK6_9PROT|nr:hypothetical protein HK12_10030 [Acetobacter orientalis]
MIHSARYRRDMFIMNDNIIKTQRTKHYILLDVVITIFAWCGFIYLVASGFARNFFNIYHMPVKASIPEAINSLLFYCVIMIILALILIGWAFYNKKRFRVERRKRREEIGLETIAESFDLDPNVLEALQTYKISEIHHDHGAKITQVGDVQRQSSICSGGENEH